MRGSIADLGVPSVQSASLELEGSSWGRRVSSSLEAVWVRYLLDTFFASVSSTPLI